MLPRNYSLYESQFPDGAICLGIELKPLSIGHLMLLNRVGSPFLSDSEATMDDLALAVFICGQHHNDAWQAIKTGKHAAILEAWAKDLITDKKGWFKKKLKPVNFFKELEVFKEYFTNSCDWPDFINHEKDGKSKGVPLVQQVKIYLLTETNLTEEQILTRPYSLCIWDYISGITQKADIEIVDEAHYLEMQRQGNELVEQLKAKGIIP